ncbi:hypothetical protein [Streptomyces cacaoi]|uniref:hypothetical protein n=1 Tax=Streptomyces cacaoi TaxID=1898 RepID=UPI00374A6D74
MENGSGAGSVGVNYTATPLPSPVQGRIRLQLSSDSGHSCVQAVVEHIDPFVVKVEPSGSDVGQEVLSGLVWPLAQAIGAVLPQAGTALLAGHTFSLCTLPPVTQNVAGETVKATLSDPSLENHDGALMVRAALEIGT